MSTQAVGGNLSASNKKQINKEKQEIGQVSCKIFFK